MAVARTAKLLGGDYRQMGRRISTFAPAEIRLVVAVISQAIMDLRHASYQQEVTRWLGSPATDPCSFLWCCHWTELNPELARKAILYRLRARCWWKHRRCWWKHRHYANDGRREGLCPGVQ